ncbi:hypothetical protein ADK91_02865 [Streptomyces sp. XY511]|uniref:SH3 domain-containing protein n=1 Tax=Streptomyces sp. XY511 TaxID=1519480 RepID=UPI0006B06432|nr:SH3 domain-containing protein [Streptomyces sp. XY511]KOV17253.1 hypothetical protein ADK91_02865 [Streptomyces sp. XY511]
MMRRLIPLVLVLSAAQAVPAAAAVVSPVPAVTAEPVNSCGYHPRQNLKLRSQPGGPGLGVVTPRDTLYVVGERGDWHQVRVAHTSQTGLKLGTLGWVAKRHVEPAVCMNLS